ncbi:MAG: hypothetical protein PHY93_07205 [Bacteriovorax sp.]|nr:hypothetical protein [Bacteriovorax sp.]
MKKITIVLFSVLISCSHAQDKSAPQNNDNWSNISSSERKQMSEMHQKMADCLKSNKSISECREYMMTNCPDCHSHGMMMRHDGHGGCMHGW